VRSPCVIYLPAAFAALQARVRSLYGVDIDDPQRFSLVLNASCFSRDRIVELLLAAGGVQATVTAV
jgi:cytidylate kinase